MSTEAFLAGFRDNPDFLLQNFNFQSKLGLVVKINESAYRTTSFLDQRVFTPNTEGIWLPLGELCDVAETTMAKAKAPYYIAHVGHCGSTLVSRLLAELPGNLPVREPIALLALAMVRRELDRPTSWIDHAQWQRYYQLATLTLSRTYRPDDRAIIKLTSSAGNLLEPILESAQTAPQILLMYISLESLLAAMLRTPDMRESIHTDSSAWVTDFQRLTGRHDIRLAELNDARQVVVKWLTLMLLFTRAAAAHPAEVQLLNFDDFLKDPAQVLSTTAQHLHLDAGTASVEKLVGGPLMRSYSKIPSQAFDAGQRKQELQAAGEQFHSEIQSGLRWADKLCRETSALETLAKYF